MGVARYDLFVSYAHADDEVPAGATKGWVTTLADELNKVLRRKLGGSGASIWMDHQLAANANVSDTLLATLRSSQTLLLVMSPGYQRSAWCQGELGNFVTQAPSQKSRDNVFIVEIEPVSRESWHNALQSLTAIRFWYKSFEDNAPRLLGFPAPKADEDNPYWRNVNELAHLIAEYVRRGSSDPAQSRPAVLLAETTEDLLDQREVVVAFLRQQQYTVLPLSDYPRDSEAAYVAALTRDLSEAAAFAQLLGPHEGRRPPGGETSFVALQAKHAMHALDQRRLRLLQWRSSDIDPGQIATGAYRDLLTSRYVQASGLEDFKQQILKALSPEPQPAEDRRQARQPAAPGLDLYVYVDADRLDRAVADKVADTFQSLGVSATVSPDPVPGQPPDEIRRSQQEQLESCDGVLIVYGEAPPSWVQSRFAFARRVVAPRRHGVWGALLDVAPSDKPFTPVKSPSLVTLDCREGLDPGKLARFVETLRANGAAAHA